MREKERMERIFSKIKLVWDKDPDLRLMQLLINAVQPKDPSSELYYYEDTNLEKQLDNFIQKHL
ncbi:MAG TPA: hypothetical protein PKY81_07425 [bacterium]|nr:hypothetical protein [bacterium]HPN30771.1 hypothetical protein [bacterium]